MLEDGKQRLTARTIYNAERDLGREMRPGEYVDLLADNTAMFLDECRDYAIDFCARAGRLRDANYLRARREEILANRETVKRLADRVEDGGL